MAQSLENYAALLREMGRNAEASKIDARAKSIRTKHAKEYHRHRRGYVDSSLPRLPHIPTTQQQQPFPFEFLW